MNFDPRSLDRLRKLGRQLPQPLPTPKVSREINSQAKQKSHPVETENNPQLLFGKLMDISPDGSVHPQIRFSIRRPLCIHNISELIPCHHIKAW